MNSSKIRFVPVVVATLFQGAAAADELMSFLASHAEQQDRQVKAKQGDPDAMYRLALTYEKGTEGIAVDRDQMLLWLKRASAFGNGMASYKLFTHYAVDPTGYAKAAKYWALAQQQGYCGPPLVGNIRGSKLAIQRCTLRK